MGTARMTAWTTLSRVTTPITTVRFVRLRAASSDRFSGRMAYDVGACLVRQEPESASGIWRAAPIR